MLDIIGIGDTNVDIMIRAPHIPSHDEKVRGQLIGYYPEGITANFCSTAAKLGEKVGAICKVGADAYGKIALEDLVARGVDTSHMVVDDTCQTYFCVVLLDDSGEKALTIVETSGFLKRKEELDLDYIRSAKRVHMTMLNLDLVEYVAEALEGSPAKLSLDIEATAAGATPAQWDRILRRVEIAFPNEAGWDAIETQGVDFVCDELVAIAPQMITAYITEAGILPPWAIYSASIAYHKRLMEAKV